MFVTNSTIREIQEKLQELASAQASAVQSLQSAVDNVRTDKTAASRLLESNVNALVIVDDKDRYVALTSAAQKAGAGPAHDYTAVVAEWTQQDAANRAERKQLEEKWGPRQQVHEAAVALKEEIDITRSALGDLRPEIEAFDATTAKIKAHNEKYKGDPKAVITGENHDGFEKFRLWPFVKWAAGWLFGKWGGEHNAYRAIGSYTRQYGDYYEKAALISGMRRNEEKLEKDRQQKQARYEELSAVVNRMSSLDSTYLGSEGIARGIRGRVHGLFLESVQFGANVMDEVKGGNAQDAALAAAKIRRLAKLAQTAEKQHRNADTTLGQLRTPSEYLEKSLPKVGDERIFFDMNGVETSIGAAIRAARNTVREINSASDGMDEYKAAPGTGLAAMEKALDGLGSVEIKDNALGIDFSDLTASVKKAVKAYDDEQERLERLRREAAERQRKALNDTFNQIAKAQQQRQSTGISLPGNTPGIPSSKPSIGMGTSGIGVRSKPSISMGTGGIKGRS